MPPFRRLVRFQEKNLLPLSLIRFINASTSFHSVISLKQFCRVLPTAFYSPFCCWPRKDYHDGMEERAVSEWSIARHRLLRGFRPQLWSFGVICGCEVHRSCWTRTSLKHSKNDVLAHELDRILSVGRLLRCNCSYIFDRCLRPVSKCFNVGKVTFCSLP